MISRKAICAAILLCSLVLASCQPEHVKPVTRQDAPALTARDPDPHPLPDPVCSPIDTIRLISEDSSFHVNYCGPFPCPPGQPEWGHVQILNGAETMLVNFTLAAGWFVDVSRSNFNVASAFTFDQNGLPVITNDWLSQNVDPLVNQWQLSVPLSDVPEPCFEIALQLTVVKLNFFGGIDPNSETVLWGWNQEWNDNTSPLESISPYLTSWCPGTCLCQANVPGTDGECTLLVPDVAGLIPPITYEWSTGATSPTLQVCPADTMDYRVGVRDVNNVYRFYAWRVIPVQQQDVACGNQDRKVIVCHVPPGNPANWHEICISWNGVPAHVASFRDPNSNPNMGHDSGCEIGPCGFDPCANLF